MAESPTTTINSPTIDASPKAIVILGGSYGGISTAHYTLKHIIPTLPSPNSYHVILVNPSDTILCRPACPRALLSDDAIPQSRLFTSIPQSFAQYPNGSFRFVHGTATAIDPQARTVSVSPAGSSEPRTLRYHALILATGATSTSPLLGITTDVPALRSAWSTFRSALPNAKSIIIGGGGPAGVEVAGELGELLNGRRSSVRDPKVVITLVTADSRLLPHLRPRIGAAAEKRLARRGVEVYKETRIKEVVPLGVGAEGGVAGKAEVRLESGKTVYADLYVPAMGVKPNTSFLPSEWCGKDGRVATSDTLRITASDAGGRVYAIGDCADVARPAVHNVLHAVPALCGNMGRDLLVDAGLREKVVGEDGLFREDNREMQIVPIGRNGGVGAAMGWKLPSRVVWALKGRDYFVGMTLSIWSGKFFAKAKS